MLELVSNSKRKTQIDDIQSLEKEIMRRYKAGKWAKDDVVVTEVIEMIVGSGKLTVVEVDPSEKEIVGFEEIDYDDSDTQT